MSKIILSAHRLERNFSELHQALKLKEARRSKDLHSQIGIQLCDRAMKAVVLKKKIVKCLLATYPVYKYSIMSTSDSKLSKEDVTSTSACLLSLKWLLRSTCVQVRHINVC